LVDRAKKRKGKERKDLGIVQEEKVPGSKRIRCNVPGLRGHGDWLAHRSSKRKRTIRVVYKKGDVATEVIQGWSGI